MDFLRDIERYCKQYESGTRETVLMIGLTGAGKSAAINTLAKLVNGEYIPFAKVGRGVAQSKTKDLLMFPNLGATKGVERKSTGKNEDEIFEKITQHLPHIIDFAGIGDENTASLREIIKLLIAGRIPPGTTIEALERNQLMYGVGRLSSSLKTQYPEWKVTKIVFVQSCQQNVPTALIKCLLSTLNPTEEGSNTLKFTGDIYVLITKYDLLDKNAPKNDNKIEASPLTKQNQPATLDKLQEIKTTLAYEFSVTGALEYNIFNFASYCSDTGYDNDYVDDIALKFLKHLIVPTPQTPLVKQTWWEYFRGVKPHST